jgi:CRP-like cAMP-binding protein
MQWNALMGNFRRPRGPRADPQDARMSDLMVDHALTLLLADEPEAALRWGAAALQQDPSTPSALVVTSRLLEQMGRTRAAIEGLHMAVRRAIEAGNVPLAVAAIDDLRSLGVDISEPLDQVADAFCRGSAKLEQRGDAPPFPELREAQPLSPFLAGPSLASKATQILRAAGGEDDDSPSAEQLLLPSAPLFSALPKEVLRELLSAFEMVTVPAGHRVVQEGDEAHSLYFVARGEFEVSRRAAEGDSKPRLILARLGAGALFGEMALLGRLPSSASVRATRPSILLVGRRETLARISERYPEAAHELAAHSRRNLVANLGWASPVVAAIPALERAMMVERLQTRLFEKGDMLVNEGEESQGLHLIVSGEVAVVGRNLGERVVLATLTAGETVGEVELVLCRKANADAMAARPTATLFLPRQEFYALVQDQPAILHGLYGIAVQRHTESELALEAGSAMCVDDWMFEENTQMMDRPALAAAARHTPRGGFAARPADPAQPASHPLPASAPERMDWAEPAAAASVEPVLPAPATRFATPPPAFDVATGAKLPSFAPMSASVSARSTTPSSRWRALQTVLPVSAAVAALAASVAAVLAVRDVRTSSGGAAVGGNAPTSQAVTAPPVATAKPPETSPTEGAPQTSSAPAAGAGAHAKARSVTPTRPKPRVTIEPNPTPADATGSGTSVANAPANSAVRLPSTLPKAAPDTRVSATASSADDFGGRE